MDITDVTHWVIAVFAVRGISRYFVAEDVTLFVRTVLSRWLFGWPEQGPETGGTPPDVYANWQQRLQLATRGSHEWSTKFPDNDGAERRARLAAVGRIRRWLMKWDQTEYPTWRFYASKWLTCVICQSWWWSLIAAVILVDGWSIIPATYAVWAANLWVSKHT